MDGWERLRVELRRLVAEEPEALVVFKDPDSELSRTPVRIVLAAWAADIAAELHAAYGGLVELHVGAMRYPARELARNFRVFHLRGEPAVSAGFDVEALVPLTVRSGWDARRELLVTNRTERAQLLMTMGELPSVVVDGDGRMVGRFVGPVPLIRRGFVVGAQESRLVPVLIGTASVVPELGYAVPPGEWGLEVGLAPEGGGLYSALLELTITP